MEKPPQRHPKPFLEELQALDSGKKRNILIIVTVVLMALVLYIWLGYFNNIVGSTGIQPTETQLQSTTTGNQ